MKKYGKNAAANAKPLIILAAMEFNNGRKKSYRSRQNNLQKNKIYGQKANGSMPNKYLQFRYK